MARTAMVTRTFHGTKVDALFVKLDTKETYEKSFVLPRGYKSERDIVKACTKNKLFEGNERLVTVNSFDPVNTKYAMSEQTFIEHATQMN